MEYNCELCNATLIITDGRNSKALNNEKAREAGWENDDILWYCPQHKLKTYTFTATTNIEARSESEAIDTFSNNSSDFAAKAECECFDDYENEA